MDRRVAVTGLGLITPLGLDTKSTWDALLAGTSGIGTITGFDPEPFPTRIAAEVKGFDPLAFMERKEAKRTDRFVQLATAAAIPIGTVSTSADRNTRVLLLPCNRR